MLTPIELLDACQACYTSPCVTAGPFGRDGASVIDLASGGTLLVFRGTISEGPGGFLDWLNDLRASLVSHPEYPGRVHYGFADALDDLWPMIFGLETPLTITGHSKGGALAYLAAARLLQTSYWREHVPDVVTFGAPMAGDYAFGVGCLPLQAVRYENPHDLVPKLPPFRYWPVGCRRTAPAEWPSRPDIVANHVLSTGYRPWIEALSKAA